MASLASDARKRPELPTFRVSYRSTSGGASSTNEQQFSPQKSPDNGKLLTVAEPSLSPGSRDHFHSISSSLSDNSLSPHPTNTSLNHTLTRRLSIGLQSRHLETNASSFFAGPLHYDSPTPEISPFSTRSRFGPSDDDSIELISHSASSSTNYHDDATSSNQSLSLSGSTFAPSLRKEYGESPSFVDLNGAQDSIADADIVRVTSLIVNANDSATTTKKIKDQQQRIKLDNGRYCEWTPARLSRIKHTKLWFDLHSTAIERMLKYDGPGGVAHPGIDHAYNLLQIIRNRDVRHGETIVQEHQIPKLATSTGLHHSDEKLLWEINVDEFFEDLSWRQRGWIYMRDRKGKLIYPRPSSQRLASDVSIRGVGKRHNRASSSMTSESGTYPGSKSESLLHLGHRPHLHHHHHHQHHHHHHEQDSSNDSAEAESKGKTKLIPGLHISFTGSGQVERRKEWDVNFDSSRTREKKKSRDEKLREELAPEEGRDGYPRALNYSGSDIQISQQSNYPNSEIEEDISDDDHEGNGDVAPNEAEYSSESSEDGDYSQDERKSSNGSTQYLSESGPEDSSRFMYSFRHRMDRIRGRTTTTPPSTSTPSHSPAPSVGISRASSPSKSSLVSTDLPMTDASGLLTINKSGGVATAASSSVSLPHDIKLFVPVKPLSVLDKRVSRSPERPIVDVKFTSAHAPSLPTSPVKDNTMTHKKEGGSVAEEDERVKSVIHAESDRTDVIATEKRERRLQGIIEELQSLQYRHLQAGFRASLLHTRYQDSLKTIEKQVEADISIVEAETDDNRNEFNQTLISRLARSLIRFNQDVLSTRLMSTSLILTSLSTHTDNLTSQIDHTFRNRFDLAISSVDQLSSEVTSMNYSALKINEQLEEVEKKFVGLRRKAYMKAEFEQLGYAVLEQLVTMLLWGVWGVVSLLRLVRSVVRGVWVLSKWFFWC
ncbi:uncharacterized protein V1516DRAFT_668938 [Lipomyces oligophaga]|uniref:uncharacterized protein n=1 Tax=Lipomyces oligophaga TaxID=45792 RepID=UPI0034CECBD0